MLTEFKIAIGPEQARLLEEAGEELGQWLLYRDALEGHDYLTGYFESGTDAGDQLESLNKALGETFSLENARRTPLEERDWREAYKDHFHPWRFKGLHWVPVWERERYRIPEGEEVIWLDPGMAFGTGNHETTRLCVERMIAFVREAGRRRRDPAGLSALDVGSGSGILALSAAKLGFGKVAGFDNDAEAVAISIRNAAENALAPRIGFFVAGLPDGLAGQKADLVLANIQSDVLCRHADALINAVAPGGALVLSGILALEIDRVRDCFARVAPTRRSETRTLGEWADLVIYAE